MQLKIKKENKLIENECQSNCKEWKQSQLDDIIAQSIIPNYLHEEIRKIACGPYSLKLSKQYSIHKTKDWKYYTHLKFKKSIKVTPIVSRFSKLQPNSKKTYRTVIIRWNTSLDDTIYFCTCKQGLRTNPCAHIISVLNVIWHHMNNKKIANATAQLKFQKVKDCNTYKLMKKRPRDVNQNTESKNKKKRTNVDQKTRK